MNLSQVLPHLEETRATRAVARVAALPREDWPHFPGLYLHHQLLLGAGKTRCGVDGLRLYVYLQLF